MRGPVFAAGVRWAIENGMQVCNMSLGTTKKDFFALLHELADTAYFRNVKLVTAANNVLSAIGKYTDTSSSSGAAAVLKGDTVLQALTGKVLDAVSYAVGSIGPNGSDVSAAQAGLQLTKDGQVTFDKAAFVAKLGPTGSVMRSAGW